MKFYLLLFRCSSIHLREPGHLFSVQLRQTSISSCVSSEGSLRLFALRFCRFCEPRNAPFTATQTSLFSNALLFPMFLDLYFPDCLTPIKASKNKFLVTVKNKFSVTRFTYVHSIRTSMLFDKFFDGHSVLPHFIRSFT